MGFICCIYSGFAVEKGDVELVVVVLGDTEGQKLLLYLLRFVRSWMLQTACIRSGKLYSDFATSFIFYNVLINPLYLDVQF